jgi:hypothetical protein
MLATMLYFGLNFGASNVAQDPPDYIWASADLEPDTAVVGHWRTRRGLIKKTVVSRPGEFFARTLSQSADRRYLTVQSAPRVPPVMAEHGEGYTGLDDRAGISTPHLYLYEWKNGRFIQRWESKDFGDFTVEWEPNRHRILIFRRSNAYTDHAIGPFYYGILNVKTMTRRQIPLDDPYVDAVWSKSPGKIEIRENVSPRTLVNTFDCKTWTFRTPVQRTQEDEVGL